MHISECYAYTRQTMETKYLIICLPYPHPRSIHLVRVYFDYYNGTVHSDISINYGVFL